MNNTTTINHTKYLEQVKKYSLEITTSEFSEMLVYHNLDFLLRIEKAINLIANEMQLDQLLTEKLHIANYLQYLGLANTERYRQCNGPEHFIQTCRADSIELAKIFLTEIDYPYTDEIAQIIKESTIPSKVSSKEAANILSDASTIDLSKKSASDKLRLFYQELLLLDIIDFGREEYYVSVLNFLRSHRYKSSYGKEILEPKKLKVIAAIEKQKKKMHKDHATVLKKELNVADDELKTLKKNLGSVKGRDERAIQTMFRTTSRNHYTLNQMVDRKSSIMISINAILISLIIGQIVQSIESLCIHQLPYITMLITSSASIIMAILAMTPVKNHGKFSEKEIRSKKGNLLYFGNYYKMSYRDYEWGMLEMLNDSNFLYGSMIKDQYFLGLQLAKKYKLIRVALLIFLVGLCLSILSFIWVLSMPGFHFGNQVH